MAEWGFETRAIHAGAELAREWGPANIPLHQSAAFSHDAIDGRTPMLFVEAVGYPGPESSPWQATTRQQFGGRYGGLLTTRLGSRNGRFRACSAQGGIVADFEQAVAAAG